MEGFEGSAAVSSGCLARNYVSLEIVLWLLLQIMGEELPKIIHLTLMLGPGLGASSISSIIIFDT